jgi:hypothetical protein
MIAEGLVLELMSATHHPIARYFGALNLAGFRVKSYSKMCTYGKNPLVAMVLFRQLNKFVWVKK